MERILFIKAPVVEALSTPPFYCNSDLNYRCTTWNIMCAPRCLVFFLCLCVSLVLFTIFCILSVAGVDMMNARAN